MTEQNEPSTPPNSLRATEGPFAPGSWPEVTRLTGWSPGALTLKSRAVRGDIELLKEIIRANDDLRRLREQMQKDKYWGRQ
jgi:hypothetical protein